MSVSTRSILGGLAAIVGRARVRDDAGARESAAIDGVAPRWVVTPATLEQLAAVLALASEEPLAVAPRGGGHATGLGGVPTRLDIVLETRLLDGVLEDRPEDLVITVQAGITAGALARHLAARRQFLPVDPSGWSTRTLGGLVATNASGPLRCRYGTLRDLLLGVRFVQDDGVITWGGARVVKSVTGYDVPKLMVGALGTLGVLGELTLRLHPVPDAEATWIARFADARAAHELVALVLDSPLQPNRLEILDAGAQRACGLAAEGVAVAVGIGSVADAVVAQGEQVRALATGVGGHVREAGAELWTAYDALGLAGDAALRVSVPPASLVEALAAVARATDGLGRGVAVRGCAAVGALEVLLAGAVTEATARAVETLRADLAPGGGTVVVARGPRELRERVDPWGPVAPAALDVMRRIKDEFDPRRVLNPGRFVGGL